MWHRSHLPDDPESIVPASALYAAESMFIAITRSWTSNLEDVEEYCVSAKLLIALDLTLISQKMMGDDRRDEGTPIGLNTRLFDLGGSFLRQASLNCDGARQMVEYIIGQEVVRRPMDEWRNDGSGE